MIYRIADPSLAGKGLLGVYPSWDEDGYKDYLILKETRNSHFAILFIRNHFAYFFSRIAKHMELYGSFIDIACGWDTEKIKMYLIPFNPRIEVFTLSAMNFDTFDLLDQVKKKIIQERIHKETDLFFAVSDRSDQLKQAELLVKLLSQTTCQLKVAGYGRLNSQQLDQIGSNSNLDFKWYGKALFDDPEQRIMFLTRLAKSKCLLVCSIAEGYSRLIGEALILGVPILLNAKIQCENWIHLNTQNCRLFIDSTFEICLKDILSNRWNFTSPVFQPGNEILKQLFLDYLKRKELPAPDKWYDLKYGAWNDNKIDNFQ
jgi:hypothetical protein